MVFPGPRERLFAFLYFCEGAPIGFVWWALPAYWSHADVPVEQVTVVTGLAVLPWSLKWLWAPLVDLTAPRIGFHRWIIVMQFVMGAALWPLVWLDPTRQFAWLLAALLVHATAAATQDVAIDGMCVASVAEHERGEVNGWMQAGMLLGRALFGGGAVLLVARSSLTLGIVVLVCLLWSSAIILMLISPGRRIETSMSSNAGPDIRAGVLAILFSPITWVAAIFAIIGGTSFEALGALLGPYLQSAEFTLEQIGWFQLGPIALAMATGALIGGRLADRKGHVRIAWFSLLLLISLNVVLGMLDLLNLGPWGARLTLVSVAYVVVGFFTASSYALFMDIAQGAWQATVFSALMGLTNACEAASALASGQLASAIGYPATFIMMTGPSIVGLVVLPLLRRR